MNDLTEVFISYGTDNVTFPAYNIGTMDKNVASFTAANGDLIEIHAKRTKFVETEVKPKDSELDK